MAATPCPQCYDPESGANRGFYQYDENHGTVCDLCCPHGQGWWLLAEHYGERNGLWCCRQGCGQTIDQAEYERRQGLDTSPKSRGRQSALAEA